MEGNYIENNQAMEEVIVQEVRKKVLALNMLDLDKAGPLVENQRDYYEGKYKNFNNYILYHALLLSNQPAAMENKILDFPGDDSVLVFLEKAKAKLEKEKISDETK